MTPVPMFLTCKMPSTKAQGFLSFKYNYSIIIENCFPAEEIVKAVVNSPFVFLLQIR